MAIEFFYAFLYVYMPYCVQTLSRTLSRTLTYTQQPCCVVAPVAETGFSHRLTAYKIVGHFFRLSYREISGHNQVKNSNISVPCPHAQVRGRTVIKKLWTFFGPSGRDRSQSPPCWIFRVKQIHQSTASEKATRLAV